MAEDTPKPEVSQSLLLKDALADLSHDLFNEMIDTILEQGAMSPDQSAALMSNIEPGTDGAIILDKRDRLANFLAHLEAEEAYQRERAKILTANAQRLARFRQIAIDSIRIQLEMLGVKKVAGREHVFSIKKNPASVEVFDETLLPAEFIRWTPSPDKAAIRAAIEQGQTVPGAKLVDDKTRLETR
jgi:hypothetical protein